VAESRALENGSGIRSRSCEGRYRSPVHDSGITA
jgi:hypothetical protein